jgi:DNA-binding response OmpR family regulator
VFLNVSRRSGSMYPERASCSPQVRTGPAAGDRAAIAAADPDAGQPAQRGRVTRELAARAVRLGVDAGDLAGKEYELLLKLASEPRRVFTKEELLREVWDFRSLGSKRCLRSTSRLLVGVCTVGPPL